MRKQTLVKAILAVMTGAAVMSACVDDKYDLSNLDTTIQVGSSGTLKLPKCSTGEIVLKNLFDLAEDGPIKEDTLQGVYYLDKGGEANPDPINIKQINIHKPADQNIRATMDLRGLFGVKAASSQKAPSVNRDYHYDISDLAKAEISGARATNINSDVVDIKRISFNAATVTLRIDITGENIDIIKQLHFDDLKLNLPKGLELESCKYLGTEKLGTPELKNKAKEEGIIVLVEGEDQEGYQLSSGTPLTFQLTLIAANVGNTLGLTFDGNSHSADLEGQFQIEGNAGLSIDSDIDYDVLKDKFMTIVNQMSTVEKLEALQRLNNGDYSQAIEALLPHQLNFNGTCKFDRDLTVQTFSGALQHAIDNIDDIKLDNLPDFLDDPEVTLDLSNPQLYLDFFTDLQTQISTDIALVPYLDGAKANDGVNATLAYDGSTNKHKVFMLAPHTDQADFPEMYMNDLLYIREKQTSDVGLLIRKIPDVIKVKGQNGSEQIMVSLPSCDNIEINKSYNVELRYRVYSRLTFGDRFQIVYSDTEDGMDLGDDLDDINDVKSVTITGIAKTEIPLDLNLTVDLLRKGNEEPKERIIGDLVVEYQNGSAAFKSAGITIRANADGKQDNDRFTIKITAASGHSLMEFLHSGGMQLDGIMYKAVLSNQSGSTEDLSPNATVQLTDIQVSVTGVSYIANKDDK